MADTPAETTPTTEEQSAIIAEQNARAKAMYGRDPSKKKPKGPPRAYWDSADYQMKKGKDGAPHAGVTTQTKTE
jgi:hypothetical protein